MAKITLSSALGEFTQRVISALNERKTPTSFFKSFFGEIISGAKEVSWEIKRRGRPVAVDIAHHEHGTTTKSGKSTQKVYVPPYYDYNTNVDALDSFERVFNGSSMVDVPQYGKLIQQTAEDMQDNIERIERAEELQAAQALLVGVITLNNGDDIDFKRKVASIVAYNAAHGWDVGTVNPGDILVQGAEFMVTNGNADAGGIIDVICGSDSINELRDNPLFQADADVRNFHFADMRTGAVTRNGATPQGSWSRGNYRFNFWGYEGYYDDPDTSVTTAYMDTKKIVMLPNNQDFVFGHGGVPAMVQVGNDMIPSTMEGEFVAYQYNDEAKTAAFFGVRSAGMPILTFVDRVFTAQVVGTGQQG